MWGCWHSRYQIKIVIYWGIHVIWEQTYKSHICIYICTYNDKLCLFLGISLEDFQINSTSTLFQSAASNSRGNWRFLPVVFVKNIVDELDGPTGNNTFTSQLCLGRNLARLAIVFYCGLAEVYMDGLIQWETTLHCNVVSHWLIPYPEWSQANFTPHLHGYFAEIAPVLLKRTGRVDWISYMY